MIPPLPVAAAAVALGCFVGGFFIGMDYKEKQYAEAALGTEREMARAYADLVGKYNTQAQELEHAKQERTIVYRDIKAAAAPVIARPLYKRECIDADGMRLLDQALTGKSPAPGIADAAVPRPNFDLRRDR